MIQSVLLLFKQLFFHTFQFIVRLENDGDELSKRVFDFIIGITIKAIFVCKTLHHTLVYVCISKNHSEFIFVRRKIQKKHNRNRKNYAKAVFEKEKKRHEMFLDGSSSFLVYFVRKSQKKYCCKSLFDLVKNVCMCKICFIRFLLLITLVFV